MGERTPAPGWVTDRPGPPAGRSWTPPGRARLLALGFGLVLTGTVLRILAHLADVAGDVRLLSVAVAGAVLLATLLARLTSVRATAAVGAGLLLAGVAGYLALVPELHAELLTVTFARRWLAYLTGNSVLGFRRVGVWAVAVAPAPVFGTWALLLHRRYDGAALVGGLALGFFALTGDAGPTTTLVGMVAALGLVGVGAVDRGAGALADLARVGFLLAVAILVARSLRLVPGAGAVGTVGPGGGGGDGSAPSLDDPPVRGDLANADDRANVYESISLSPTVLFTLEADAGDYWRVMAYDRYTGADWIRTGPTAAFEPPLDGPVGEARPLEQRITVETAVGTLPAAWKPVAVAGLAADRLRVTDLGDVTVTDGLAAGETYTVRSRVPFREPARLRAAGTDYPPAVGERYRQLPGSTADRVTELAAAITADTATPYDGAVAIERWLPTEKDYDLAAGAPDGDLVEGFLFGMSAGYCVHFASAMTVLLRAIGVPARYVLGYSTGQRVGPDRWVLRGLDSHAWVEAYFPRLGWVRFDPTPTDGRRRDRQIRVDLARAEDLAGVDTNESLLAAAQSPEELLGEPIDQRRGAEPTPPPAAGVATGAADSTATATRTGAAPRVDLGPSATLTTVEQWVGGRDRLSLLAGAVGLSVGLHWLGAIDRGVRAVRVRWQRPTGSPRRDAERAFERLELLLAGRFRPRRPGETRRAYLAAAESRYDLDGARRVLALSERASYGGAVDRAEADAAIRTVDAIVEAGPDGTDGEPHPGRSDLPGRPPEGGTY